MIVPTNYKFRCTTSYFGYKISSQNSWIEPKINEYNFFQFWSHFIDSADKLSICLWKSILDTQSQQTAQLTSNDLKMSLYDFFPVDLISLIAQIIYQFWPFFSNMGVNLPFEIRQKSIFLSIQVEFNGSNYHVSSLKPVTCIFQT